jgi:pyruvate kinase
MSGPLQTHKNGQAGLGPAWDPRLVARAYEELQRIRADMMEAERRWADHIEDMQSTHRPSACNLLHYMALRRHDIRGLQEHLAEMGLSSLGRSEAHVLASLDAVLALLGRLRGGPEVPPVGEGTAVPFAKGRDLLVAHTEALLGPSPAGRAVRIMVTMPTEAADDEALVGELLRNGMDIMRVNCAHDDAAVWARMIEHLERARRQVGRECRVLMDVAGPKLRTGPVAPGPQILRWRPRRDARGAVTAPARIWLHPEGSAEGPPLGAEAALPMPEPWLAGLRVGDRVDFTDLRGSARHLRVVDVTGSRRLAECDQTAYVGPETLFRVAGPRGPGRRAARHGARAGAILPVAQEILLKPGDTLFLTRSLAPGTAAVVGETGQVLESARIGCTLPEVFGHVRPGEQVWFDDGKLGGTVAGVEADGIHVRITRAAEKGTRLGADKGINLPDTGLPLAPLTPKDLADLPFIAGHADLVGFSFVRRPEDVRELESHLGPPASKEMGLILKIETRQGFEQLPRLLLAAFAHRPVGVMIARGDLAVECGFERLAEVQEEMLWVCEAAHVPVIWATQVLETLAKKGMPTRAEISDAAMAGRAECVMLNKGPFVVQAVRALDDILHRMEAHQRKKSPRLRALRLSETTR